VAAAARSNAFALLLFVARVPSCMGTYIAAPNARLWP
jgi:hypothetical protein